jgi:restriction system protein
VENTKLSCDQGADLLIRKYGEKIVVQAKRYNSKVSNSAIQEAVASVRFYSADKAYVVTSNYFTKSACELAQCNNVRLIDRDELIELTSKYYV